MGREMLEGRRTQISSWKWLPPLVRHQVDPGIHTALTGHGHQEKARSGPVRIRGKKSGDLVFQNARIIFQWRKVGELGYRNVNYTNWKHRLQSPSSHFSHLEYLSGKALLLSTSSRHASHGRVLGGNTDGSIRVGRRTKERFCSLCSWRSLLFSRRENKSMKNKKNKDDFTILL